MPLVKSLLASLLGGAIGAGVLMLLPSTLPSGVSVWGLLLAGILAGLFARFACGAQRTVMTGTVAAAMTVVSLAGVSVAQSFYSIAALESSIASTPNVVVPPPMPEDDTGPSPSDDAQGEDSNTEDTSPDEGEANAVVDSANVPLPASVPRSGPRSAPPESNTPFIVYSLAGVIAFVLAGPFGLKQGSDSSEEGSQADVESPASDNDSLSTDH